MSGERLRDARRVGFAMVYKSATQRIRAHFGGGDCTVKVSTGLAVYVALAELTNDARHDPDTGIPRARIAEYAGVTPKSVSDTLPELERGGLIHVERRQVDGVNLPNVITLLDTDTVGADREPDVPGVDTSGSDPSTPQVSLTKKAAEEGKKGKENARAQAETLPDDFPEVLVPHARGVYRTLKAIAEQHNAREVTPRAVGLAMQAAPGKRYVAEALGLAGWAQAPPRPVKDVVATYRTWLGNAPTCAGVEQVTEDGYPAAPQAAAAGGNVTPMRRGGRPTAADFAAAGARLQLGAQ